MPMSFPDMDSLVRAAGRHGFRSPNIEESEDDFRESLAVHVAPIDMVESMEIRAKVGWDQWGSIQKIEYLRTAREQNLKY